MNKPRFNRETLASARPAFTPLTRRRALGLFTIAGAAFVAACGDGDDSGATPDGGSGSSPEASGGGADAGASVEASVDALAESSADGSACVSSPEGEIGPYFADDSDPRFNRSNILANLDGSNPQTGVPLTLQVTVLDTENGCAPYANAQVDIWHCNSSGVYSDQAAESTSTETWLRGYQISDASGTVTFTTIVPGWYSGRTTHIHLRIRSTYSAASSTSDGANTTQLFFDQSVDDNLAVNVAPYSAEGVNPTTNAADRVFSSQTDGANVLTLRGDATNGYVAAVTLGLPIVAS
jgi:protocatechuate 3,4-dioxygenase beta subunit